MSAVPLFGGDLKKQKGQPTPQNRVKKRQIKDFPEYNLALEETRFLESIIYFLYLFGVSKIFFIF